MRQTAPFRLLALVMLCLSLAFGGLNTVPSGAVETDLAADLVQTAPQSPTDTADPDHPLLARPGATGASATSTPATLTTLPHKPLLAAAGPKRPPRDAVVV